MHPLDDLIAEWASTLEGSEPALVPHLDEIIDHVRADAEARMAAGADASTALAAALGSFGAPRDIATDYRKTAAHREHRVAAVTTIVASLVLTAAFVAVDKAVRPLDATWLVLGWAVFVLPIDSALPHLLRWREGRSTSA